MESSRKAQRGDRRRRVLREDASPRPAREQRKRVSGSSKMQLYVEDAVGEAQPRVTDLIPQTKYGLTVWFLCAMLPMAAVQALFVLRATRFGEFATEQSSAFRLVGPGTVATWLTSVTYLFVAAIAIVIYCVRRHKVDDYRGRYRLWLWVAMCCTLCSLDMATGLHTSFSKAMVHLTGKTIWGDGTIWWMLLAGVAAGGLFLRVIIDTRRSRGTLLALLGSAVAFVTASLLYVRVVSFGVGEVDMMAYVACLMTAETLLVFGMLVYARFIHREASGASKAALSAKRKRKSTKTSEASLTKRRWFWRRERHGKPAVDSKAATKAPADAPEDVEEYEEVESSNLNTLARLTNPGFSKNLAKNKKAKRQERRAA